MKCWSVVAKVACVERMWLLARRVGRVGVKFDAAITELYITAINFVMFLDIISGQIMWKDHRRKEG